MLPVRSALAGPNRPAASVPLVTVPVKVSEIVVAETIPQKERASKAKQLATFIMLLSKASHPLPDHSTLSHAKTPNGTGIQNINTLLMT